jgi:hypothetical protein
MTDTQCLHERTEVRARPTASGGLQYAHQCLDCGVRRGDWVKKPTGDVPAWDAEAEEETRRRKWKAIQDDGLAAYNARRESEKMLWWRAYDAFMQSRKWKEMRKRVLYRAGGRCESCLLCDAVEVHHTVYPKVEYNESAPVLEYRRAVIEALEQQPLYELRAICYDCHARQHPHRHEGAA